jgi:siroheme synthase-like protein
VSLFPLFLKLHGRRCLVVGAGKVALEKISSLLQVEAEIEVIAPAPCAAIEQLATESRISLTLRQFDESDLAGRFLVVTATNSPEVNRAVFLAAQQRGILCNSVDDPPHCDFYFGSVVRRGDLQIAISTAGESPALAQRLRREIDAQLPRDTGTWLAEIGKLRREILTTHPAGVDRKALLHKLAERLAEQQIPCGNDRKKSQKVPYGDDRKAVEKQIPSENDRQKNVGESLFALEQCQSRQFADSVVMNTESTR